MVTINVGHKEYVIDSEKQIELLFYLLQASINRDALAWLTASPNKESIKEVE